MGYILLDGGVSVEEGGEVGWVRGGCRGGEGGGGVLGGGACGGGGEQGGGGDAHVQIWCPEGGGLKGSRRNKKCADPSTPPRDSVSAIFL